MLYLNKDFELIAQITGQPVERLDIAWTQLEVTPVITFEQGVPRKRLHSFGQPLNRPITRTPSATGQPQWAQSPTPRWGRVARGSARQHPSRGGSEYWALGAKALMGQAGRHRPANPWS